MSFDEIEKYDSVMESIDIEGTMDMIRDQIEMPGESMANYLKTVLDKLSKSDKISFCEEVSLLLEKTFPIKFEEDAREDYHLIYNTYKLLIENLVSSFTVFISQYINDFSKKKSFLKTYSHIKPTKTAKNMSKESYIVITNMYNIISDICDMDIPIDTYLENLDRGSEYIMPTYMLDAFNSGKISEEGLVKRIYKILESRGLLDAIITKVLMDYTNKNKTSTDVSFNNELTELEDEELEDADE